MSKRKHEDSTAEEPKKKQSKTHGFSVGPANLPDGTYRRKTQKIKNDLISKAKVKKAYAKVKAHEDEEEEVRYDPYAEVEDPTRPAQPAQDQVKEDAGSEDQAQEPTNEIHPDRQAMLDAPEEYTRPNAQPVRKQKAHRGRNNMGDEESNANLSALGERGSRPRDSAKPVRYQKEFAQAEERKTQEAARLSAQQQRKKERRAMTKAKKPGKDGKQKLGRQSDILLSRVKRLVGKD